MSKFTEVDPSQFDEETRELYKLRPISDADQEALRTRPSRLHARQYLPIVTNYSKEVAEKLDSLKMNQSAKLTMMGAWFSFSSWMFLKAYYPYGEILRASLN